MLATAAMMLALAAGPDDYTIRVVVRLVKPYDVAAMNDEFQTAKLLEEKDGVGTFEIVVHPLHQQTITANPNWREDDKGMTEYLRPRPAANWDAEMRSKVLAELKAEGIDPSKLDDKTCVERVAAWAMKRSTFNDQFGLWMVKLDGGTPTVPQNLREVFEQNEPKGMPMAAALDRELFGKGMFENKTHGACTSTSTYMATILRSIGIPTRIIITDPVADGNDPQQVVTLLNAVQHKRTRFTIRRGLPQKGDEDTFSNHLYNEVWVGKKWVRLNYQRLGQPVLDRNYLGLMLHVFTANDFSEIPFAETWGARYGLRQGPKLSSINPYQLVSASDNLSDLPGFPNPPEPEVTKSTIVAVKLKGDALPNAVSFPSRADGLLFVREWEPDDDYRQMRDFIRGANQTIVLRAAGHPDVTAKFVGSTISMGDGKVQAYGFKLSGPLAAGAAYSVVVDNTGYAKSWDVAPDVVWKGR